MSEETETKGKKWKSKWAKVLEKKDALQSRHDNIKHDNNVGTGFDENVVDFLKPSTEASAAKPKLNLAVAQRWPDAQQVKNAHEGPMPVGGRFVYRQPRTVGGLSVGFVKTVPEIIGEGGDESEEPVAEISRRKSARPRSVSARQPRAREDAISWASRQQLEPRDTQTTQAVGTGTSPDNFRPAPVRRVQTSHDELSPPLQRKVASPPIREPSPPKPILNRVPTGLSSQDDTSSSPPEDVQPAISAVRPAAASSEHPGARAEHRSDSARGTLSPSPIAAKAPTVRKQRDMQANEGMTLRRASALYMTEEQERSISADADVGFHPSPHFYNALSDVDASGNTPSILVPDISLGEANDEPYSALSPTSPSPFADPKYTKRRSDEQVPFMVPPSQRPMESATPPVRQPQAPYQPSYMRSAQQPQVTRTRPSVEQPSYMRLVQHDQATSQDYHVQEPGPVVSSRRPQAAQAQSPPKQSPGAVQQDWQGISMQRQGAFDDQTSDLHRPSNDSSSRSIAEQACSGPALAKSASNSFEEKKTTPLIEQASYLRERRDSDVSSDVSSVGKPDSFQMSSSLHGLDLSLGNPPASSSRNVTAQDPPPNLSLQAQPKHNPGAGAGATRGPIPIPARSPLRDRSNHFKSSIGSENSSHDQPKMPNSTNSYFPPTSSSGHSRNRSREEPSLLSPSQTKAGPQRSAGLRKQSIESQSQSPGGSLLTPTSASNNAPSVPSPYSRGPSPADYFSAAKAPPLHPGTPSKSPGAILRQEEAPRPGSAASTRSAYRPMPSPSPVNGPSDPGGELALADFAGRVAHMSGVFRLTAEKERPAETCAPEDFLRTAAWWYSIGKTGLETLLQRQYRHPEDRRELLMQPHVDLAKAWWILSDRLESFDVTDSAAPQSAIATSPGERALQQAVTVLKQRFMGLCASMAKSSLMPPHQSLIQGQDTTIWLTYPQFAPDAAAVLSGNKGTSLPTGSSAPDILPVEALPLGDTREFFNYARSLVSVALNTDEAKTDRVTLPCMLTVLRGRRDYQPSIVITSQNDLINIKVGPKQADSKNLTWHDVSWKASSCGMVVHLPRGFDLSVRMHENDFRTAWNVVQYAKKVEHSMRPEAGERLVHEVRLAELQYIGSSGSTPFPQDKVKSCSAMVFERHEEYRDGNGLRSLHRGFRLLLVTDPSHKALSCVSHDLYKQDPLYFEMLTDAAANGTTAMVIRVKEEQRQCRMLLVFPNAASRSSLYDVLNGLSIGQDECIVGKMAVTSVDIRAALQGDGVSSRGLGQQNLQWSKLGVTNRRPTSIDSRIPTTVESDHLRIIARHTTGCVTDRINLGKGELQLRLATAETLVPVLQILREPQEDITASVDERHARPEVVDATTDLLRTCRSQATIREFRFASLPDLHNFQAAITGFTVLYDGVAASFGISRRMMVVPIHHKWQAANVRLQLIQAGNVTRVLAFMEDFTHADALCFQVKSSDNFEAGKGDSKGKKWTVKMVDAKFSLPRREKGEIDPEQKIRRRYVNLEGLDYAEEHDDITVSFDTEQVMAEANGNPNTAKLTVPQPPGTPRNSIATRSVHADDPINSYTDVAPALHVSSTFRYPHDPDQLHPTDDLDIPDREPGTAIAADSHIYSRLTAPNSSRLELLLTSLIGAPCLTYTSGLAAFHALLVYVNPKVVAIGAGYHGCHGVLDIYKKLTKCKVVDLFDEKSWDEAGLGKGDMVHLETPVNPTGKAYNIQYYAELAHKRGAVLTIDSTFAPPPLQDPFKWGADYVMHSGTKYIGGHSDMLCGVVAIGKNRESWEKDYWTMFGERLHLGAVMGSMEGWLGVRSLRTFELRVARQSQNADKLVAFLDACLNGSEKGEAAEAVKAVVAKVDHASLQASEMGWLKKQMPNGFGPVFSIDLKNGAQARRLPSKLSLFHHATSLGGVESLIEWRRMSDNTVADTLCRVSIGVEAWEDLRDDLVHGCMELAKEAELNMSA
ncbi:cystathionine beta-lyase [Hortaea werneckii]|nr:cystathionine beta-lyase [Hortaea werneckii]